MHLGFGRQISLPKNEIAMPISFQMVLGKTFINSFSIRFPSLNSGVSPILGETRITCRSVIMPTEATFASRMITLADFLPIPFKAVSASIENGIFSSLLMMICCIEFVLVETIENDLPYRCDIKCHLLEMSASKKFRREDVFQRI